MGHSSKKKKKRGGRRTQSKDHNSTGDDNSEILAEELTALCAIFQDDCKVVSESPPQISIKLRPYSKDTGYEDSDTSALLSVRCLQGYPHKCPKLQIVSEKGLSKSDADNLLSLLYDQANANAREGRVMIYNLVEAAQEFLSEIIPQGLPHESVMRHETDKNQQLSQENTAVSSGKTCAFRRPIVYSHVDLFSGSGESWHWNLGMEENNKIVPSLGFESIKQGNINKDNQLDQHMKPSAVKIEKSETLRKHSSRLGTLEEESEDDTKSTDLSTDESVGNGAVANVKDIFAEGNITETEYGDSDSESSESTSSESVAYDQPTQTVQKDVLLAHLLRVACAPKGPLADSLAEITSELLNLGIISESVRDLAVRPPSSFDKTFDRVFRQHIISSKISRFWTTASDFEGQSSSVPSSRYLEDFEELQPLGRGGFGHVVLCKNKLDGRQYAVKKIQLKDKSLPVNDHILREVATLSRLQHQHVVRYYQAWYETRLVGSIDINAWGSKTDTGMSSSFSGKDTSSSDLIENENKPESTYLYIQMEYCPRTLKQMFDSYNNLDKELAWHLFRQIVEGLGHIHGQGIIHRDLTPSNIFFDARNDIKIGDFGLAKFLKLEQLDQEVDATETIGASVDGTGQIGTYFYTAPEIEQGWPKINEKVDMYSLGVVFFELWHPFDTAMERHVVLSDLKQKGELPSAWITEFPEQASLLRRLMSPIPSDRPSATELIKHAFPPQMEYGMLDNILRTIHNSEDTSIYEKIVSAIFDEDMLSSKHEHAGILKSVRDDTSSNLFSDVDTANRDLVLDIAVEVCRQHCAKHLEIVPMSILGDCTQVNRNSVKLLTHGGDMVEFCHELRMPFVKWIFAKQKSFFRRYEISYVYRRAIGHSPPNRYLQGDFDIVGGATALTEAEVIKATMDIVTRFFNPESCDLHLNHGDLLEAIWSWAGIKMEYRQKVAELLSLLGSLRPQSSERKSKWVVIRRQLRQELNLEDDALNRLQTVGLRFCGTADQALPRLRGALPSDKSTRKALDELSELFNYLRIWRIDRHVFLDALMPPTEYYHRKLYFQLFLRKDNNPVSLMEGILLAVGGRYDYLLQQMADSEHHLLHSDPYTRLVWRRACTFALNTISFAKKRIQLARVPKSNPPGAVGTSVALETIMLHSSVDSKSYRNDMGINVLVCSRGGGGLLVERMELVAELWEENIKAEYVPLYDPSLTEQYEYASEHDIKCLVVITDSGVSQKGAVKVRHLELKKEKEVERENLVKFLSEAMETQFRNPSIWS